MSSKKNNSEITLTVNVKCEICGEPLTVVNEHGMFCRHLHGLEESIQAKRRIKQLLKNLEDLANE